VLVDEISLLPRLSVIVGGGEVDFIVDLILLINVEIENFMRLGMAIQSVQIELSDWIGRQFIVLKSQNFDFLLTEISSVDCVQELVPLVAPDVFEFNSCANPEFTLEDLVNL